MEYNKINYLNLLKKQFKTREEIAAEIINLESVLELPKGTEVFLSDIHGEYEPFAHILNNGAGRVRTNIESAFKNTLTKKQKNELATLIYYPKQKIEKIKNQNIDLNKWYIETLKKLIKVCRKVASKYTISRVNKTLPPTYAKTINELLYASIDNENKSKYYTKLLKNIVNLNLADEYIEAISDTIKKLAIDKIHILGDLFDKGNYADKVIERLMELPNVDIQWGNHDIVWMGAACGNDVCIAHILRASLRYDNLRLLEDVYGINLRPLATFAVKTYHKKVGKNFIPKVVYKNQYSNDDKSISAAMNKTMAILQFKLEGQLLKKHPEYEMNHRLILDKIDIKKGTVTIDGKTYELNDTYFPTIDWNNPYELSPAETELFKRLKNSFINSKKLQEHIKFIYEKGSVYKIYNSNLLFHGCIPTNEKGYLEAINLFGKPLKGKRLFDELDTIIRNAYFKKDSRAIDLMWYLWCGPKSPFFGRSKYTQFEQCLLSDKESYKEEKSPYYKYRLNKKFCIKILNEFGIYNQYSHIINGHTPIKRLKGESPVSAEEKLLVIDGGMAKGYREEIHRAGYTLAFNSYGLVLSENEIPKSIEDVLEGNSDIKYEIILDDKITRRLTIGDTDEGEIIKEQISALKDLLRFQLQTNKK